VSRECEQAWSRECEQAWSSEREQAWHASCRDAPVEATRAQVCLPADDHNPAVPHVCVLFLPSSIPPSLRPSSSLPLSARQETAGPAEKSALGTQDVRSHGPPARPPEEIRLVKKLPQSCRVRDVSSPCLWPSSLSVSSVCAWLCLCPAEFVSARWASRWGARPGPVEGNDKRGWGWCRKRRKGRG
jgi:hypothetical protein